MSENDANLPAAARDELEEEYTGTRLGRQELSGEPLEDVEGALWQGRMLEIESRRGGAGIIGLGKLRYVVEQTFAQLHQFKRLAIRWERRLDLHNAFVSLACALICYRRLIHQRR